MLEDKNNKTVEIVPMDKAKLNGILRVTLILAVATAIEFVIAFVLEAGITKTGIFVVLTIVKAYYIVGEFMHLSHERKSLIWSVLLPCIFVVWLIVALLMQGSDIYMRLFNW